MVLVDAPIWFSHCRRRHVSCIPNYSNSGISSDNDCQLFIIVGVDQSVLSALINVIATGGDGVQAGTF